MSSSKMNEFNMDETAFTFRARPPTTVASSSCNLDGASNCVQEEKTTVKKQVYPHLHLRYYCALCGQMFLRDGQKVIVIRQSMESLDRSALLESLVVHPGPAPRVNNNYYLMDTPSPGIVDNLLEPRVPIHPDHRRNPTPQPLFTSTPANRYVKLRGQTFLKCVNEWCPERQTWPACAVAHPECISGLELIDSHPRMRQGLWQLLTWSAPWRDAPMQFFKTESRLSPALANIGCEDMPDDFPIPTRTQPEAKQSEEMIQWTLARQLDLYTCLQQMRPRPLTSISLTRLPDWKRGQGHPSPHSLPDEDEPTPEDDAPFPPYIRISIDAYGICQIERIAKPNRKDSLSAERTDNKAFIVIEAAAYAKQVEMQFMNGLARMEIINGSPRFQIWDTPTPPSTLDVTRFIYPGCTTFGNANNPRCRFFSIKFEDTVGITFLFHPAKGLVDIQQHRKAGPASYVQPLLDYPADSLVCMYLPTESDTDVCGMSIQVGDTSPDLGCPRLVIETVGAGTVNIGRRCDPRRAHQVTGHPKQLFFTRRERGTVDFIGTYWNGVEVSRAHHSATRALDNLDHSPPYYSFAPLCLARSFDIYRYSNGTLRCLVVSYNNGVRRMLGDYRVGQMPEPETFQDPKMLCFNGELGPDNGAPLTSGILMSCGDLEPHFHENAQNWKCYPIEEQHVLELFFKGRPAHRVNIRNRRWNEDWPTDEMVAKPQFPPWL